MNPREDVGRHTMAAMWSTSTNAWVMGKPAKQPGWELTGKLPCGYSTAGNLCPERTLKTLRCIVKPLEWKNRTTLVH